MSETSQNIPSIIERRLQQIRFIIEDMKVEAMVLTYLPNIRYLTNYSGSFAAMFIFEDKIHFITDDRYEDTIEDELYKLPNMKIHISRDIWEYAKTSGITDKVQSMAFESNRMPYSEAVEIRNIIRPIKFKPTELDIERFTIQKDPIEIEYIKRACEIAELTYKQSLKMIKPGMSEKEVADELNFMIRKNGSEEEPFGTMVLSGPRTALVHAHPSDRKIKKNELVLLDFGAKVNGFGSDITRMVGVGKATKEQVKVYQILREAQRKAIQNARPGINGKILDAYARDIIVKAGFGDNFKHSLGHGIGIDAHESPIITFRKEDQLVSEDCVISIEPGIYLKEKFGIRVEDNILVTRNGVVELTKSPEEIEVI